MNTIKQWPSKEVTIMSPITKFESDMLERKVGTIINATFVNIKDLIKLKNTQRK